LEKDKISVTVAKPPFTIAKPGKIHGLKSERDGLPGFRVDGGKINFRKSWGGKIDFFLLYLYVISLFFVFDNYYLIIN
jgi:hypothetical protein